MPSRKSGAAPSPDAEVGATRKRIQAAAIDLFQRRGQDGLTMRAIAREVGLSATALYRHYPNRDAILHDVWHEGYTELAALMAQPIREIAADARILVLLERYVGWAFVQPGIYDLKYRHTTSSRDALPRRSDDGDDDLTDGPLLLLVGELQAGIERGDLEPGDVWTMSTAIWALAHGLIDLLRAGQIDVLEAERVAVARNAMRLLLAGMTRRAEREALT